MAGSLREKTVSGMLWNSVGHFGTMILNFVSNLVLARLLLPSDYGCVGMLHVFIAFSNIFVTAGFGTALIQKKNPTHVDYTSVFYWSFVVSIIFYWILFFSAPAISRFYNMPELCAVLRVQSLGLVLQTLVTIQTTQMQKQLRFKELSKRSIIAALAGTIVAIIMALCGCGVWSLVVSHLVAVVASVALLWRMSSWRPTLEFSWGSLKELFSFGGLVALSSFVETLYGNLLSLILGKWYSPSDLGYYTQAKKLEQIPTGSLGTIVGAVSLPVFSSLQDSPKKLLDGVRKSMKSVMYVNVPMMTLLMIIAKPLIDMLYGVKWELSAGYFQILCIGGAMYTLNSLNVNVIKALGKGKTFFFTQLIKRVLALVLIVGSFFLGKAGLINGINGLIWAVTISFYTAAIINMFVNRKLIGYGFALQIKDVLTYFLVSGSIAALTFFVCRIIPLHQYIVMFIEIFVFMALYILASIVLKLDGYNTFKDVLYSKFLHRKR